MELFFTQLANGLAIGSIYALIALGYTMVYGILKLINFAHGDLFGIGAYLGLTLLTCFGLIGKLGFVTGIIVLAVMIFILVGIIGIMLEKIAYKPLRNSDRLSAVVSALGASIFLQNALMLIYGARIRAYPANVLEITTKTIVIFGLNLSVARVIIFVVSIVLMIVLYLFVQKTKMGVAIRAVAIDHEASKLMGINVNTIITIVFLIGPALGGIAGLMVGLCYGQVSFMIGWSYGLKAFIAAILGGIGNIPGAMVGGILLGVVEALGAAYLSLAWKDAIAFFILILILIVKPTGILGERVAEKI